MNADSLSIVIPSYNEANRIPVLLNELEDFLANWPAPCQIIIVNDGSTDNSMDIIKTSALYRSLVSKGSIEIIDEKVNRGKGHALMTGVMRASFDRVLTIDADMATHPDQLKRWSGILGGSFDSHTVYIGCRIHKDSHITDKYIRKVAGATFNACVRFFSPLKLDDTQCGFKLYPATIAKKAFSELKTFGWAHDVELLCRCQLEGYTIVELPVEWNAIEGSKISVVRDAVRMFIQVVRIKSILNKEYKK